MSSFIKFSKNKNAVILVVGIVALILAFLLSICVGSSGISVSQMLNSVFKQGNSVEKNIFLYVRLPRTIAAAFAGAALALSGAILQRVLANKLASPSIIGVNAGAGLGVTICGALGVSAGVAYSVSAFLGSMFAIFVITLAAYKTRAAKSTVILGGVAINAILNACSEAICVLSPDAAIMNIEFRIGGLSSASYLRIVPAAVMISVAVIVTITLLNDLEVISMGDETARGLGMNVRRTKIILLSLSALLAGAAVSYAGLLGFIGLIVPHFAKKIFDDDKYAIFGSIVFGAAFLVLSDIIARVAFAPFELPVGIIMAFVGGPTFVALLIRRRGGHAND